MDEPLPLLEFAADLRRTGAPARSLRIARDRGELLRVRRGAYTSAAEWKRLEPRVRHLVAMQAMASASRRVLVFSHESAAAAWGMPALDGWPATPHVTEASMTGWRTDSGATWHLHDLGDDEVADAGGFRVTDPLRTAIDIAASRSFSAAVAALDHVLADARTRSQRRWHIERRVRRRRPFRGVRRVDAALDTATGLAESPLESLSMARFAELGIPRPRQQHELTGADGRSYRLDFFWPQQQIAGEADGRVKYSGASGMQRSGEDELWREKRREDAIRARCRGFARWSWTDARDPVALRDILARAGLRR